ATGTNTIAFNISGSGVHTISVTSASPLPVLTNPVVIDGTTQPGYAGAPLIQLLAAVPWNSNAAALEISAGSSTVKGLAIGGFGNGIQLEGQGGDTIQANYIGTDPTGTAPLANDTGVFVASGIGDLIGGTVAGAGNLISGNDGGGIYLGVDSSGTLVQGN